MIVVEYRYDYMLAIIKYEGTPIVPRIGEHVVFDVSSFIVRDVIYRIVESEIKIIVELSGA